MRFGSYSLVVILLALLSGCGINTNFPPFDDGGDTDTTTTATVIMTSQPGKVFKPGVSDGGWYGAPRDNKVLYFRTSRDGYNNPQGLEDDTRWYITDVKIKCDLKDAYDTIFNPGDPYRRNGFSCDGEKNACLWFPTFTARIEGRSGLPYSLLPVVGYPFDSCYDHGCLSYPVQEATIYVTARAEYISIKIFAPRNDGGTYVLDIPGSTQQNSREFELNVGEWGDIDIIWTDGRTTERYTVTVPSEWFWTSSKWRMTIGAV